MNGNRVIKYVLWIVLIAASYLAGAFLHPKVAERHVGLPMPITGIEQLLAQPLVDINTGALICSDTLFSHERNLLVFWTPTCRFCRQFFQYRLNQYEVGIFCFPITDDLDYARYFVERNGIQYPNIGTVDSSGIMAVKMPTVNAVPTFVVLDSNGDIFEQQVGINGIDDLLDRLYNQENK